MEYTTLGRTGLSVSVTGLGCGGHSRLGQSYGHSFEQSAAVVSAALDAGVNFIDTAAAYGTEEIVGEAIRGRRDEVVISSKLGVVTPGTSPLGENFLSGQDYMVLAERNLARLGTDRIDIFHLHGVMPNQYDYCRSELVPALLELQEQGKIRFLGLTERFIHDTDHSMLRTALQDECWDVVMTGFNLLNPSARRHVLRLTTEKNIGTLIMFAVRRALSDPAVACKVVRDLVASGEIPADQVDPDNPLGFLVSPDGAASLTEAAYRFCQHEPGTDVILTGTGSVAHLHENLDALQKPKLPDAMLSRLTAIFDEVESISGN